MRKLLFVIVAAIVLFGLAVQMAIPALQVTIEGIGTLSVGSEITYASPDWWNTDWQYRIKLTIAAGDIGSDLSNFPVLVHLSSSCGKGGSDLSGIFDGKTRDNGEDIRFVDSDDLTLLNYEIEKWDNSGEAWIWVKLDSVSSSEDTEFYMYYGNPGASDGQNPTAVWDDSFKMVQHLEDDPDTSHTQDSTVNDNDGTKKGAGEPVEIEGKIGRGQDFDGTDDKITVSDSSSLSFTGNQLTIEAWVKVDTLPGTDPNDDETAILRKDEQWQIAFQTANSIRNLVRTSGTTGWTINNDEIYYFSTDTWYYWTFVYNGSKICHLIDAQQVGNLHTVTGDIVDNSKDAEIGRCVYTDKFLDGIIDEVRVSNTARSADWIKASYESGRDNLLYFGSEETPVVSIAVSPSTPYDFGTVAESSQTDTTSTYFTLTNDGNVTVNTTIKGTDATGETTWILSDDASVGIDIYGLMFTLNGTNYYAIPNQGAPDPTSATFVTGLAASGNQTFGLRLLAPSKITQGGKQLSATITISAVQAP